MRSLLLIVLACFVRAALAAQPKKRPEHPVHRRELFERGCWQCHGKDLSGNGPAATALRCKARLDYYREDLGVVFDVKTCEDARPAQVERDLVKWGYHLSAAHYLAGLRALGLPADNFAWIFVEKKPPYAIGLYMASPALLDQAGREWADLMARFARCRAANDWPGYPAAFMTIDLPVWARDL